MKLRGSKSGARSRRLGMISMELVLTLPLLLAMLLAIFEFTFLLSARSDVLQASRAGARLGTLNGVQREDIEIEVINTLGSRLGPVCQVESNLGDHPGDEVIVTVRVPMSAATPNLLWPVGYDIRGRDLIAQTRMLKE